MKAAFRTSIAAVGIILAASGASAARAVDPFDACPEPRNAGATGGRQAPPISIWDLATIEDIGPPNNELPGRALFTLSPSGSKIALQVRRGDPSTNRFCLAMIVVSLDGQPPITVDRGDHMIRWEGDSGTLADFPSGIPLVITPRWSPDGRWIAFLKFAEGHVQVWRAETDGSGSRALTHSDTDIRDFRISATGDRMILVTRPGIGEEEGRDAQEALRGYHLDDRFMPGASNQPFASSLAPLVYTALDLKTGALSTSSMFDWNQARREPEERASENDLEVGKNARVRLIPSTVPGYPPRRRLEATMADGRVRRCAVEACLTFDQVIGWSADRRRIRYMRHEGWAFDKTAIYEWRPGGPPRRVLLTDDYFSDCKPLADDLLCSIETPTRPRHIARVRLSQGRLVDLFDPNRALLEHSFGQVETMEWRNRLGVASYGRLVLPVGYERGKRYPLIVVTYIARGFLRGGTGDEYPIHALSGAGYAVLAVQNPFPQVSEMSSNLADVDRELLKDFRQRRSVLSSIEVAVQTLIDRGVAEPSEVGIAGLSDGSSTVQFAGVNSTMFRAGSMGSCCWEPTQTAFLGPDTASLYARIGWPKLTDEASEFWRHISWMKQPDKVSFPVLMQLADEEYLGGLESYTALTERGRPADLFVFPDEHHVKWQPAHRLALYQRNLDWFDFWLRGRQPTSILSRDDGKRWEAMRSADAPDLPGAPSRSAGRYDLDVARAR